MLQLSDEKFVPVREDDTPMIRRTEVRQKYQQFYRECSEKLIWQFPMLTYNKTRYAAGDKLELLSKSTKPPSRGLSTVNAWTITSIATRLGQTGEYSVQEEELEAQKELEMVHPSYKYGASVNQQAQADSVDLDEAKSNQIRTFKAVRAMSTFGESTVQSTITCISQFMRDPRPPAPDVPVQEKIKPKKAEPVEPKEKITSNVDVLGDTGSVWSSVATGTSMATTTANFSKISCQSVTPLRARINRELAKKGKEKSIPPPKFDVVSSDEESLPETTGSDDLLNQAAMDHMMEETIEDIQETARKRPKNLLLGKLA